MSASPAALIAPAAICGATPRSVRSGAIWAIVPAAAMATQKKIAMNSQNARSRSASRALRPAASGSPRPRARQERRLAQEEEHGGKSEDEDQGAEPDISFAPTHARDEQLRDLGHERGADADARHRDAERETPATLGRRLSRLWRRAAASGPPPRRPRAHKARPKTGAEAGDRPSAAMASANNTMAVSATGRTP